jgi:hypothetical protein
VTGHISTCQVPTVTCDRQNNHKGTVSHQYFGWLECILKMCSFINSKIITRRTRDSFPLICIRSLLLPASVIVFTAAVIFPLPSVLCPPCLLPILSQLHHHHSLFIRVTQNSTRTLQNSSEFHPTVRGTPLDSYVLFSLSPFISLSFSFSSLPYLSPHSLPSSLQ